MKIVKRIFLFILLNILVITAVSVVLSVLNVQPYLTAHGLDLQALLIFCLIWGMCGAFISLALSRKMAKWMLGVKIVANDHHLTTTVHKLARAAGASHMPEVGIYESKEVNAFATGPTKKRSLVAVSSGLLNKMNQEELEGVIAHEMSHILNGDMVTMTLLQGVINAFVMFLARALAYVLTSKSRERGRSSFGSYMLCVYVFQILFMILGSIAVATFSRWREFRADRGGAEIAGKEKMISALRALQAVQEEKQLEKSAVKDSVAALKISAPSKKSWLRFFATHPPLEERINRLKL